MKYLVVDALLNGTGIRDYYTGEYLEPEKLGVSISTIKRLTAWLLQYQQEHYRNYSSNDIVDELDHEGKQIAALIKRELSDVKVNYLSDAKMTTEIIS